MINMTPKYERKGANKVIIVPLCHKTNISYKLYQFGFTKLFLLSNTYLIFQQQHVFFPYF
jgi:hypothetical protein